MVRPRLGLFSFIFAVLWLAASSITTAEEASDQTPDAQPAPQRPRIGLVLSGGGARGAAHIGVLKVLEEMHVPIDAIAGTSMGAVVGGLYASGLSPREIEAVMTSLNWQDAFRDRPPREDLTLRRKQEDQNFLVKFPLGLRGGKVLLPKGLIQGQRLNQTLRRLTLPVAHITNFDDLAAPFRAVATDLETGDAVIIGSGDLTSAMRASLSAPGVFAPVDREGRLLVDGGIADNLPIDVARAMGVDVLIVVDVGAPLLPREKLSSAPVISNQMLAILIQRSSREQLAKLAPDDIVIRPALGDASSFDFGIVARVIGVGEAAARGAHDRLAALALGPQDMQRYVERREQARRGPPRIEFVEVESGSQHYSQKLESLFKDLTGKPLDPDAVARRVTALYGQGTLDTLDYRVVEENDRYGISLTARDNSIGPNYLRFGLNLQDDLQGSSTYNAAMRFVMSEITQPGGEWVWDLQIGQTSLVATEVFLPLSASSGYFVMPHAATVARDFAALSGQNETAQYRVHTFAYGVDFGRQFGNWGEIRTGVQREEGHSTLTIGTPPVPLQSFATRAYFLRFSYDRLDDVNFPRNGQQAALQWQADRNVRGSDQTADQITFNYLAAHSFGRHTAVFSTSAGTTLESGLTDVRLLFPLGGLFNLSGLKANSLTGPHFGIARLQLYRQIGRGGPGYFDVPTYLGMSLEAGNVWQTHRVCQALRNTGTDCQTFGNTRRDAAVFLGLDTLLGPVYLASGFDEHGDQEFYLFLGRTF